MTQCSVFRYFNTSAAIIRAADMIQVRFPLSLRDVEDLPHGRGIDICHEAAQLGLHRLGPLFAVEISKRRVEGIRPSRWRWHPDEVFVKINSQRHPL